MIVSKEMLSAQGAYGNSKLKVSLNSCTLSIDAFTVKKKKLEGALVNRPWVHSTPIKKHTKTKHQALQEKSTP